MEQGLRLLLRDYTQALQEYLVHGDEAHLLRVDALGRRAVAEGYGTLALTGIHHEAALTILFKPFAESGARPLSGVRMFCGTCPSWYSSTAQDARTAEAISQYFRARLAEPPDDSHGLTSAGIALRHVTELLEREAKRIAHTLHDEAGQLLTVVHLKLAEAEREVPLQCRPCFGEISVLLDRIEGELRRLAHDVQPTLLADYGLLPAIQLLADGFSRRTGIAVVVEGTLEQRLPSRTEAAVYRTIQEGLTNAARHSAAREVRVSLRTDSQVHCRIQDDGKGFDAAAVIPDRKSERGFGLAAMRERVEVLGGTFTIASRPGHGADIGVSLPLRS